MNVQKIQTVVGLENLNIAHPKKDFDTSLALKKRLLL